MRAIAKTNLFLRVVGKRSDSYHELENVFIPLPEVYDDVEILPGHGTGIYLRVDGNEAISEGRDNLCLKAADAFCAMAGIELDLGLLLRKKIPVAAGLGGGSSDAAAVLKLLNEHCGFPLKSKQLYAIAAELGADVPYFLNPVPALGKGRGDILTPIQLNVSFAVIMVMPCFPLSVKWTFAHWKPADEQAPSLDDFLAKASCGDVSQLACVCRNDLGASVFEKFPLLKAMRDFLMESGALTVQISGSGPSLFALSDIASASNIANVFHRRFETFLPPVVSIYDK